MGAAEPVDPGARVDLTVIIPAYNEVERLEKSLTSISEYLSARFGASEIVVVDDGSADGTFAMVKRVAGALAVPVRAFRYPKNRGKGFALKVGFARARGDLLLFSDADLSTPIDEAEGLVEALARGFDVAIGSRKMPGAELRVRQPWLREKMGQVFTLLVRALFANVSDVTCGFKGFRGEAGRELFARVRLPDWSFDAELLYLCGKLGYRLVEVPVRWEDRSGTKVQLLRDALRSMQGLVRIALHAATGAYGRRAELPAGIEGWSAGVPRDLGEGRAGGGPRP